MAFNRFYQGLRRATIPIEEVIEKRADPGVQVARRGARIPGAMTGS